MVRSGRVLFSLSQDRISVEEAATKAASSFRMSDVGTFRTWRDARLESVMRTKADVRRYI